MPVICKEFDNKAKLIDLFIKAVHKAKENDVSDGIFTLKISDTQTEEVLGVSLATNIGTERNTYFIGIGDHYIYFITGYLGKEKAVRCKLSNKEWNRLFNELYFLFINTRINLAFKKGEPVDYFFKKS